MTKLNVALTIAGTDPTGGAGIMADLKSFQARGTYGMAVVTSVVAQNTTGVQKICNLDLDIIEEQLKSVFSDIVPDAQKTGMLATKEVITLVANYIDKNIPYVLDPVMVATSGDKLIDEKARTALKEILIPKATIITPNLPEAEELLGKKITTEEDIQNAGKTILSEYGCKSVLIKGGHLEENLAIDYLFTKDEVFSWQAKKIKTNHTHGTGCTLSAVICAELAKGKTLQSAVATAKKFITVSIEEAPHLGRGNGPVNHTVYKD